MLDDSQSLCAFYSLNLWPGRDIDLELNEQTRLSSGRKIGEVIVND